MFTTGIHISLAGKNNDSYSSLQFNYDFPLTLQKKKKKKTRLNFISDGSTALQFKIQMNGLIT